ncbi:MAG: T9SS type A sorting domain-containing protein [Melioribacteraceae bacterium]|nr:T9SS type A sorting domain-containing protein [Melioribacteraceae bacterium]
MRFFLLALVIVWANILSAQNSNSDFYPLAIGNKWFYESISCEIDCVSKEHIVEVISDTVMSNGFHYYTMMEQNRIYHVRFDSLANTLRCYEKNVFLYDCGEDSQIYSFTYEPDSTVEWKLCDEISYFITYLDKDDARPENQLYDYQLFGDDSAYLFQESDFLVSEQIIFEKGVGKTFHLTSEGGQYTKSLKAAIINGDTLGTIPKQNEELSTIINDRKASKIFFLNRDVGGIVKNDSTISITSNGGLSWENISFGDDEKLSKLQFVYENDCWVLGVKNLYFTNDGGSTWFSLFSITDELVKTFHFINRTVGFIGMHQGEGNDFNSAIYYTNNSGASWYKSEIDSIFQSAVFDFSFVSVSDGIANSGGTAYKTIDGGKSWKKLPIGAGNIVGLYDLVNCKLFEKNCIVLGASYADYVAVGYYIKSTDGGITWGNINSNHTFLFGITDDYLLNEDSIWASTPSNSYFSENGGQTWDTLNVNIDRFSFISNKEAYGLSGNQILFTEDGWKTFIVVDNDITVTNEISEIPRNFNIFQNYPNPFNPSTTIEYSIPSVGIPNGELVQINVFDVLGNKIKTLYNGTAKSGNHKIKFDGKNLPSGTYFIQINHGDFRKTIKALLIK